MTPSILIVDDRPDNLELLRDILEDVGYQVRTATDSESAMRAIEAAPPDLLLLDLWLRSSREGGIEILERSREAHPQTPVIMISAHGRIETAVQAIEKGAFTFLEKPINSSHLTSVVRRALDVRRIEEENLAYRSRERREVQLLGKSPHMARLRGTLDSLADGNARVLFRGALGSGREEAARYLHLQSPRSAKPFGNLAAAQLSGSRDPAQILETALQRAEGGMLLIEEVADLDGPAQNALLRVLVDQTRSRDARGGLPPDVRILATTSRDLKSLINEGRFRDDLYYRLGVVELYLPPLTERRADIPQLLAHFMNLLAEDMGRPPRTASPQTIDLLQSYEWPGNVRELRNLTERLMISEEAKSGQPIAPDELPGEIRGASDSAATAGIDYFLDFDLRAARQMFETRYLELQVARAGGNVARMVQSVGMERTALHRKLKTLGITSEYSDAYRVAGDDEESGEADATPEGHEANKP